MDMLHIRAIIAIEQREPVTEKPAVISKESFPKRSLNTSLIFGVGFVKVQAKRSRSPCVWGICFAENSKRNESDSGSRVVKG